MEDKGEVTLRLPNKHNGFFIAGVSLALIMSLVGCTPIVNTSAGDKSVKELPAPVTEQGMTLDWGEDIKTQALHMIDSSQKYCYLDMYELSDPDILHALISAHHRGVDVRVIVDATEPHSEKTGIPTLKQSGVPVNALRISRGISHIKMLLTDGEHGGVLIGGMNFGERSWENNDASVYLTSSPPSFQAVFHFDWNRAGGIPAAHPTPSLPLLTDREIGEHVVAAIHGAQHSISIEAFNLSDRQVLNALRSALQRGVRVEVLLDSNQSENKSTAVKLREEGATVRFYKSYNQEWMHAKIVDIDQGSTFIIGSANFSHQAYTYNHEGDLELHNVPQFDASLQKDLSIQISRGTDYPSHAKA